VSICHALNITVNWFCKLSLGKKRIENSNTASVHIEVWGFHL